MRLNHCLLLLCPSVFTFSVRACVMLPESWPFTWFFTWWGTQPLPLYQTKSPASVLGICLRRTSWKLANVTSSELHNEMNMMELVVFHTGWKRPSAHLHSLWLGQDDAPSYKQRCKALGLPTKDRRKKGDMIEVSKLVSNHEDIPCSFFYIVHFLHIVAMAWGGTALN